MQLVYIFYKISCFFSFTTAKPFPKIQEILCQGFLLTPGRTRGFVKPKGNKKSRPSVNRKTGNKFSRYHFRWQTAQSLSYRVTAANPSAFTYAGFSALSCRRSGMSSRLCPAALHQTAALCKKGALRYCFPSKRFSMCTDVILTTFHCPCQAQSLKKPIIFHRN